MNKKDLINAVSEKTGLTKKNTEETINAFLEVIQDGLVSGEKIRIAGFGNFEVRERSARTGRVPSTGEEILIPATKVPAFKAGKGLKDAVKFS